MEFALNPIAGVVQDSSGNILDRELAPTYSQIYYYDKYKNEGKPDYLQGSGYIDEDGQYIFEDPANKAVNDILRGEKTNANDFLEDSTGILTKLIQTAIDSNALNQRSADITRAFNHDEAEISRRWQEHMRDTQIESTMRQLRNEGINPLLALNGSLSYANSSAGAQANASNQTYSNDNQLISSFIYGLAMILSSAVRGVFGEYSGFFTKLIGSATK